MTQISTLLNDFPFLTFATYGNNEYLGIIQNQDSNIISMYVYTEIKTIEERKFFLECGSEWWWETNRMIPINIVLGPKFEVFQPALKSFNIRDFTIKYGPTVCLKNLVRKQIKRKKVQLVRRVK